MAHDAAPATPVGVALPEGVTVEFIGFLKSVDASWETTFFWKVRF